MRVRFQTPVATKDRSYHAGTVADVPDELAKAWLKGGNVTVVRDGDKPSRGSGRRQRTEG